jgi:hypothetical protein
MSIFIFASLLSYLKSGGIASPPPLWRLILATHLGVWRLNLVFPHVGESPNLGATQGGGGVAWVALSRAFPQTQGISFLSRSP